MKNGNAPYAYDSEDGKIEIHHIGQQAASPFAELTFKEHMMYGNNKTIHSSENESWRNNPAQEKKFYAERERYWKKRAKGKYTVITEIKGEELPEQDFELPQEIRNEIKDTIEVLFNECSVDDLDFLSDLAKSCALVKRTGASSMNDFLFSIRNENESEIRCAYCKSTEYILYGCYSTIGEKMQRYKCRRCGRIFSPISNSLISSSNLDFKVWIKFIDCLYNGYTLNQIAKTCGISEQAAHDNRIRLFYALKLLDDKVKLQGNIVTDETYVPVSYKGNRSKKEGFIIPREIHRRGGENHTAGISKNNVCIVCAMDESGNSVAHAAGVGNSSVQKLNYALLNHLPEDELVCLYSDKSPAIKAFAEENKLELKQEKLLKKNGKKATNVQIKHESYVINRYIQRINSYHSRLKRFLNRFSGTSTQILSGYLYLFAWKERNKDKEPIEAYKELLAVMTEPDLFVTVDDIMSKGYLPDALKAGKKPHKPSERDAEIYRRYAAGETMASIGEEFNMSKQNVSLIVARINDSGYGYKTEKEKQAEKKRTPTPEHRFMESHIDTMLRDYLIYDARMNWTGLLDEFYKMIKETYGIGTHYAMNIISHQKRIERLRDEFFIYEDISYKSLAEVYQEIYFEYQTMREEDPERTQTSCVQYLADKNGFKEGNILRIINIMSSDGVDNYFDGKKKLTSEEAFNRDKAMFIDFLKWNGDRNSFCKWAAKKYALRKDYVSTILKYCLRAKIDRIENVPFRLLEE